MMGDEGCPNPELELMNDQHVTVVKEVKGLGWEGEEVPGNRRDQHLVIDQLAIERMTGIAAIAHIHAEYGCRPEEEIHLELRALMTLEYEDGDNMVDFLDEFQHHVNSLASLGRRIDPDELYVTLKSALPVSYHMFVVNLG